LAQYLVVLLQTLITGGGSVGSKVAIFLSRNGESVRVVEQDKAKSEWLSKNSDATVYNGNALDPAILLEAGIDKADTLIVAIGSDEITAKIVDFAKSQFGVQRVIAVTKRAEFTDLIKRNGADKVICAEDEVLDEIENVLQRSDGQRTIFADKQSNYRISRVMVRATSRMLGKRVSKIEKTRAKVPALVRGGQLVFPDDQTDLEMGDEIFVIGTEGDVDKVANQVLQEST
jgi:trk system potassium uptake protein TrkA